MTSMRDLLIEHFGIGETFCLAVDEVVEPGTLAGESPPGPGAEGTADPGALHEDGLVDVTDATDDPAIDPDGPIPVAVHPNPHCEYDVAIVEGRERLATMPPEGPVSVRILGRFVDGHLAGRALGGACDEPANRAD